MTKGHAMSTDVNALLQSLSTEDKEAVFLALVRELIQQFGGRGLIPLGTLEEPLGYYVPPEAANARLVLHGPKWTAESDAEIEERLKDLTTAVPISQAISELREEEVRLRSAMIAPQKS